MLGTGGCRGSLVCAPQTPHNWVGHGQGCVGGTLRLGGIRSGQGGAGKGSGGEGGKGSGQQAKKYNPFQGGTIFLVSVLWGMLCNTEIHFVHWRARVMHANYRNNQRKTNFRNVSWPIDVNCTMLADEI